MDKTLFIAKQLNRFIVSQLIAYSENASESNIMEYADLYPTYEVDKNYTIGDIFKYGVNADNESQLYSVLQAHKSAAHWLPEDCPSLYKKIGITEDGTPIWTQPLGAMDAYQKDDIVYFPDKNGSKYKSKIDNNVWSPTDYPAGWELI